MYTGRPNAKALLHDVGQHNLSYKIVNYVLVDQ